MRTYSNYIDGTFSILNETSIIDMSIFVILVVFRFVIQYILNILFPPPGPQILSTTPLAHLHILSLFAKRKIPSKQNKEDKNITKTHQTIRTKAFRKTKRGVILYLPTRHSARGACLGVWLVYPVALHRGKLIFPLSASINFKVSCLRTWCLLPLLCARILSSIILCIACAFCHSLCEFICVLNNSPVV